METQLGRVPAATIAVLALTLTASAQIIPVASGWAALRFAVQAAPSGATLILSPGTYDGFQVHDKVLTIYAPQRATIEGDLSMLTRTGASLRLRGLDVVATSGFPSTNGMIWGQCDLTLEDCTCENIRIAPYPRPRATVRISGTTVSGFGTSLTLECCDAVVTDSTFTANNFATSPSSLGHRAVAVSSSSVRFERIVATGSSGIYAGGSAIVADQHCSYPTPSHLTIADSSLNVPPMQPGWPPRNALEASSASTVTLSNTILNGTVLGPHTFAPLATAEWTTRNWTPGGTSTITLRDTPTSVGVLALSWDFVPFATSLIGEQLFVGATSNYLLWNWGVSDATGALPIDVPLPGNPALQYQFLHVTGVFLSSTPWRSTATIGGLIK